MILRFGAPGLLGVVFSVIGAAGLAAAAALGWDLYDARQHWTHATGYAVAEHCRGSCRPEVEFEAADGKYAVVGTVASSWSQFDKDERVEVLYRPEDPRDARIDVPLQSYSGIAASLGSGVLFGGLGSALLLAHRRRARGAQWAREFGQRVQTEFVAVERAGAFLARGRQPFRVVSQWLNPRDRKLYRFASEAMWIDPSRYLREHPQVMVRLDPEDPKHRYWMDLAFLPKAA